MSLTLTPEQEAAIERTVRDGRYASSAEALQVALTKLSNPVFSTRPRTDPVRSKNLADLLSEHPWAGSDLEIERDRKPLRDLDL
jgi:Arc/MetJ-type ribon-helix-helix transcriptional regulator